MEPQPILEEIVASEKLEIEAVSKIEVVVPETLADSAIEAVLVNDPILELEIVPEVVEITPEVVKITPEVFETTPEVVEIVPEVLEITPEAVEITPEVEEFPIVSIDSYTDEIIPITESPMTVEEPIVVEVGFLVAYVYY